MLYDTRLDRLARVLVRYSVGVKKGDVIRLRMPTVAEPLLLAAYKQVVRAGGHPVVRMAPEECAESLCRYGKPFQLDYTFACDIEETKAIDGEISAWSPRNTRAMSNVDPKKQTALSKARKPILDVYLARLGKKGKAKLRWVGTQFPCQASAQDAEMSLSGDSPGHWASRSRRPSGESRRCAMRDS